jgi:hypothetical protein
MFPKTLGNLDGIQPSSQPSIESEPVVKSSPDNPKQERRRKRRWDPIGGLVRFSERTSNRVQWTLTSRNVLTEKEKVQRLNSVALWLGIAVVVSLFGWFGASPMIISLLSEKKQPATAESSRPSPSVDISSVPFLEQRVGQPKVEVAAIPVLPPAVSIAAVQSRLKPVRVAKAKLSSVTELPTTVIDSDSKEFSREYELGSDGETLSKLAIREWGAGKIQDKYTCIAAANGIEEPDIVQVGQRILIPRDCSKYSAGIQQLEAKYAAKHKATNAVAAVAPTTVSPTSDSVASSFFATFPGLEWGNCSASSSATVSKSQDATSASSAAEGLNASFVLVPFR